MFVGQHRKPRTADFHIHTIHARGPEISGAITVACLMALMKKYIFQGNGGAKESEIVELA